MVDQRRALVADFERGGVAGAGEEGALLDLEFYLGADARGSAGKRARGDERDAKQCYSTQADALKGFKANSQSTLIAFKGATETGRLVGATKADAIEGLLQTTMKK